MMTILKYAAPLNRAGTVWKWAISTGGFYRTMEVTETTFDTTEHWLLVYEADVAGEITNTNPISEIRINGMATAKDHADAIQRIIDATKDNQ